MGLDIRTPIGLMFGIFGLLLTGYGLVTRGSDIYQRSLGYILTFLLAGMGVVSILHTYRNLAHIAVSAGRVEPAFAGGTKYRSIS